MKACRKYRFCGYSLLVLTVALGSVSIHTIQANKAIIYPGFLIYAAAAFTFYNLIIAIYNVSRYRKLSNPIASASKFLAFASAFVSVFFLQASMFSAFGDGEPWQYYMNIGTGAFVFALIVSIAVYMIRTARKEIEKYSVS